nr:PDR ABC-type transporter family protein [Tanacetum cinerariifolium]
MFRKCKSLRKRETTLKRPPNPFELFMYTYTKNHDKETFIDKKAKRINDNMLRLREAREANHAEGYHLDIPVPSTESDTEDNNEADTVGRSQNPNTSNFEEHEV